MHNRSNLLSLEVLSRKRCVPGIFRTDDESQPGALAFESLRLFWTDSQSDYGVLEIIVASAFPCSSFVPPTMYSGASSNSLATFLLLSPPSRP